MLWRQSCSHVVTYLPLLLHSHVSIVLPWLPHWTSFSKRMWWIMQMAGIPLMRCIMDNGTSVMFPCCNNIYFQICFKLCSPCHRCVIRNPARMFWPLLSPINMCSERQRTPQDTSIFIQEPLTPHTSNQGGPVLRFSPLPFTGLFPILFLLS